jgi:hypothetical protein
VRAAPLLACVGTPPFSRASATPTPAASSVRPRQQNVDIMLQNLDKTEALENKSADLANQAKTCAASPATLTSVQGQPGVAGPPPHRLALCLADSTSPPRTQGV